jgi:hypothetical protein
VDVEWLEVGVDAGSLGDRAAAGELLSVDDGTGRRRERLFRERFVA